MRLLLVT
ncbi:hypothetical protein VCHC17A2_0238A, partial [Vibrio cholerae HC-17A2]